MGKNIGGTLGEPYEGMRHTHALNFYDPLPSGAAPNDDLDLQLVWLKMMEEQGLDPSVRTFAEYWARYAKRYPWNEYGFFMRNFSRGLRPPVAGCFENYFVDEMGSPIRSEIWACLHPGDPQAAAKMAWRDSALDHAGGEGMFGEMFWAAVQAAAFVENEPELLIRIGLNMIPLSSHIARAIREAVWCHENGLGWGIARERIAGRFGHIQPCNAVPNHGFIVIGWLYGADFGDCLCKAVNCGYDTDCTGATLGALLGILHGTSGIPEKWIRPVGEEIKLHKFTGNCDPPRTVSDLTDRTVKLAERCVEGKTGISFGSGNRLPDDFRTRLFQNTAAWEALRQDIHAGVELLKGKEIWFHYSGEPVIYPGIGKEVAVSMPEGADSEFRVSVPEGWDCTALGQNRFRLSSADNVKAKNTVRITSPEGETDFTLLGPTEARGFAAGENVPSCPKCGARLEACMCRDR
jgi:ADP-ribosylglycohydrolase